jgi:glyoxylase-like metal-dependent hydrolase (beta-lactamase superfamily II)
MPAPELIVESRTGGVVFTNGYLVADPDSGEAVLIDAPAEATTDLLELAAERKLKLRHVLLTHGHWDHITEVHRATAWTAATVAVHPDDEFMLGLDQSLFGSPYDIPPRKADFHLKAGADVTVGPLTFSILHTPGHSPGSCCLLLRLPGDRQPRMMFGGDLLFAGSIGRTDLPGGDWDAMARSLREVMKLRPDLPVHPGHGPSTTIGEERRTNPYVAEALGG